MRLTQLKLTNFRCFKEMTLDFQDRLNVIVSANGQGKTAILDAVKIALWQFVSGFDLASSASVPMGIEIDDVRVVEKKGKMEPVLPSGIEISYVFGNEKLHDGRMRESMRKGTKTKDILKKSDFSLFQLELENFLPGSAVAANRFPWKTARSQKSSLKQKAESLEKMIFSDAEDSVVLPVICYYGTGRLWKQKSIPAAKRNSEYSQINSRTLGYKDCLDPASSFKNFAEWYAKKYLEYNQEKEFLNEQEKENDTLFKNAEAQILPIQKAINGILKQTGWRDIHYRYSYDELALKSDSQGILKVRQLSDGIRNVLGLVADIAYRCVQLNPQFGEKAVEKTPGIVLIDEVDMYLHPSWQQTILPDLLEAFPKVQFIVTTHSPHVVSSISHENIYLIDKGELIPNKNSTFGAESSRILKEVFNVDNRADTKSKKDLDAYFEYIESGNFDSPEARECRGRLDKVLFGDPALIRANMLMERKKFMRQREKIYA